MKHLTLTLLLVLSACQLSAQTGITDTLYQSDTRINWLTTSNGYIYWFEFVDTDVVVYRLFEGTLDSLVIPEEYTDCDTFGGIYAFGDFLYMLMSDGVDRSCDLGFVWEGEHFSLDPYGIGKVGSQYENLILTRDSELFDISTKTKTTLNLENELYACVQWLYLRIHPLQQQSR